MILDKYESTGNDILLATVSYLSERGVEIDPESLGSLARKVCHRHFGIGADHLILLDDQGKDREEFPGYTPDTDAHCRMIFFNSDGSPAEMSGNGIRCFALFAQSQGYGQETEQGHVVCVETLAGTKSILLRSQGDGIIGDVNMGVVSFEPDEIPVNTQTADDVPGVLLGKPRRGFAANSGIPHWTLLLDSREELEDAALEHEGLTARFDERFANNTNVDAVVVTGRHEATARFFERGAHETLSCGTGVTAVAAILHRAGLADSPVTVTIRGGQLTAGIQEDGTWLLSGPVRKIARCEIEV